ncbi:cyclopropane-fatty-acyl-phospholipid synthase [Folsomia candida]|uniref:cyclopropane-fatty-acyl-phospholipid synthase n=1 Tax=Folsomia candida TaxID=158441 RepID=UPI001604B66B|nr:cyclopropane-fatty-acyl-phospholipid synthase [Folsomia candida]
MGQFHILHFFTALIVRSYKWLELNFLKIFTSCIERKIRETYQAVGVNFWGAAVTENLVITDKNGNTNLVKPKRNSWDFVIHSRKFFSLVANHASLGMAETYMDNMWDCDDLVELSYRIMKNGLYMEYLNGFNRFLNYVELSFFNLQSKARAFEVGKKHYDIGNDLFESFLDERMTYSCGYWANATTLAEAQVDKMELIAQKLKLKPGMRVLDIGCGWGGLCKYLAEKHGVKCVGISISEEGVKYANLDINGLPVEFRLMDYRDINETFDRVVSVGMMEHVGKHNYRTFFKVVHRCLSDDGIFLLHTIGNNHPDIPGVEPFFHTYIFPNAYLPYYKDIAKFTEGLYVVEDWHNFGFDYSKTLLAWKENFDRNWPKISDKYGERFYRMWSYYLQFSAGGFRSRRIQLWQVVLSKTGCEGGYISVR